MPPQVEPPDPPQPPFPGVSGFVSPSDDDTIRTLKVRLEPFTGDEAHELHSLAVRANSWVTWLFDRYEALSRLKNGKAGKASDLVDKFKTWRTKIDFYLYTNLMETAPFTDEAPALFTPEEREWLVKLLLRRQRNFKSLLTNCGIDRIEATRGSNFVAGVLEISKKPPVPTENPSEDDRVSHIEPGEGGYRTGTTILAPTLARRFEYRSPSST